MKCYLCVIIENYEMVCVFDYCILKWRIDFNIIDGHILGNTLTCRTDEVCVYHVLDARSLHPTLAHFLDQWEFYEVIGVDWLNFDRHLVTALVER